jgi:hypothetical protein
MTVHTSPFINTGLQTLLRGQVELELYITRRTSSEEPSVDKEGVIGTAGATQQYLGDALRDAELDQDKHVCWTIAPVCLRDTKHWLLR